MIIVYDIIVFIIFILSKIMIYLRKTIVIFLLCLLSFWLSQNTSADDIDIITKKIFQQIDSNPSPRESLVQWYYSIDDFYSKVYSISNTHKALTKISSIRLELRNRLDFLKKNEKKTDILSMFDNYRLNVTTKDVPLSNICKDRYQLVDDWSYAFNMPTPLVLATLDMESSCWWYKPTNGDWVFQLIAKDYGTGTLTTGQWIMMMYDFSSLVSWKHAWYHTANKLSKNDCDIKNKSLTGTTSPICLTYTSMDLDSIIKHGALYNGLANATIKWNIQPWAPSYIYGRYTDAYSGSVKDGLITRVLKVVNYMKENNIK